MSTAELLLKPRGRRLAHPHGAPTPASDIETATERRWARPALFALLALTAFAYLWDLSASNYANSFYAAAVQAGTKSWKAFFFGSLDASNFITVDKPPASLWVMELSGRIFGFSSWSMLVPQALEGVAAVALLHATVRRWFGAPAGLLAAAVFALTPVAALMFRFNNPDALLVLTLVAAAYCLVRALEVGATRWVLATGAMVGFAFLAKMGQAFLVLPAFAGVYVLAAPVSLRRRCGQLLAGGAALLVSAGWWVAIVALWPASSRPFIDGSPDNSILNLITGYNGLGRIFGSGGPGGGGGGANFSGATGPLRLFNSLMGGQASWLLPAALLALAAGLWATRRAPRTDRTRAALLLWGGWLLVTAAIFSFGQGVIHTYYTVALAPAIGALVAIGAVLAWRHRHALAVRALAALAVAATAIWAHALLARTPSWEPWLRAAILPAGLAAAGALLAAPWLGRRAVGAAAALALCASLAGPAAYAVDTITTPHTGSVVSAGPAAAGGGLGGGLGGPGGGFARGGTPRGGATPGAGGTAGAGGAAGAGAGGEPPSGAAGAVGAAGSGGAPSGASSNGAPALFGSGSSTRGAIQLPGAARASGAGALGDTGIPGGPGAARGGTQTSAALTRALRTEASRYRWVAATSGSQSAADLELATDEPVMAIGGFDGEGGNLSLAQFESYISKGEIHYYIVGGGMGGGPGGRAGASGSQIAEWVAAHFRSKTIGGTTVYDLTSATS